MTGAAVMVCGTSSDCGKSRLVTGICRAFRRRGLLVAPFKGQNMALNSVVAPDGAEIGRAQGTQAQAAGVGVEAAMNPVLLKPTSDRTSQVVVMGRPWAVLDAASFHRVKPDLEETVLGALAGLRRRHDVVVCEGAGSPAEVNLMDGDLVNLGLAVAADVPALVVGDIDRGGVFAHLYGTVALLPDARRRAVRGFILNKLRGDPSLLGDATTMLEQRCGVPTLGVVPYLGGIWLDAEDSLGLGWPSQGFDGQGESAAGDALDVAVLRLPRISNFTDADPLVAEPNVGVRFVDRPGKLGDPDVLVVPGTKATIEDLEWLRSRGLADAVARCAGRGTVVVGICGGYQMLGTLLRDPLGVESRIPEVAGLGMLCVTTTFSPEKVTRLRRGRTASGGVAVDGYQIHHGRVLPEAGARAWFELETELEPTGDERGGPGEPPRAPASEAEGVADPDRAVFGTSLHGVFESDGFRRAFLADVARRRGKAWQAGGVSFASLREAQIDLLADACERHLDLDRVLEIAESSRARFETAGALR